MAEEIIYDEKEQALQILSKMYELRQTQEQCDFIIRVGNVKIFAHRRILMVNSEYLRETLTKDTPENRSGCVIFEDMDAELVKTCLDSMYCRKIYVTEENRENLLKVAIQLKMLHICYQIAEHYVVHMDVNSFYNTKMVTENYRTGKSETIFNEFALDNFQAITQLDGFQQLPKEYVYYLLESKRNATPATYKVKALMNWTRHDPESRRSVLCEMLQICDLHEITDEYRWYLLHTELLTRDNSECLRMLGSSAIARLDTEITEMWQQGINGIAVFNGRICDLKYFNLESGFWKQMPIKTERHWRVKGRLYPPMQGFLSVSFGEYIHIFATDPKFAETVTHHMLNFCTRNANWQQEQDISLNKVQQAIADVKHIYVTDNKSIVAYDPTKKTSTVITTCHGAAAGSTCVCFKQSIYFIGGRGERVLKVFDITSKKTHGAAPLLKQRTDAAAAVKGENIYVIGGLSEGQEPVSEMDIYCINTNTWTSAKQPMNPESVINAFAIGNKIFTLSSSGESIIQHYQEESDDWEIVQIPQQMNLQSICGVAIYIEKSTFHKLADWDARRGRDAHLDIW